MKLLSFSFIVLVCITQFLALAKKQNYYEVRGDTVVLLQVELLEKVRSADIGCFKKCITTGDPQSLSAASFKVPS